MDRIVLFGGTTEGRLIAEAFAAAGLQIDVFVATEYGEAMLPKEEQIQVHCGRLEEGQMEEVFRKIRPCLCLDATHPHAVVVSENLKQACERCAVPYHRMLREESSLPAGLSDSFVTVGSAEEAVDFLEGTEGRILLTTGSKELKAFAGLSDFQSRCIVRVLPSEKVLQQCYALGLDGRSIIAMQGPFSEEMNYCLLKQYHAAYLVTKESGSGSGYAEKCAAAVRAGACMVIIRSPEKLRRGE